jgi:hypothetical protein
MSNGSSFVIGGSENSIVIYNKSANAEQFILDYFENNGLAGQEIHRIEVRLSWNYIRHLRNRKHLDIDIETLLDVQKLATIFQESTKNKIVFDDTLFKTNDKHGNTHCKRVSVVDDLPIIIAEIGQLNPIMQISHYNNDLVDESILRQCYYRFLETGHREYFQNFRAIAQVARLDKNEVLMLMKKFNARYKGNRNLEIQQKMDYTINEYSRNAMLNLNLIWSGLMSKMKWISFW